MVNLSLDDTKKLQNATEAAIAEGGMRPHDAEKRRLAAVVEHLAGLIQRDRDAELRLLKEESDVIAAECKAGKRPRFTFLPTPQEVLAKRLYDKWIAAGELLPDVEVHEGYCFLAIAQWFVVRGNPEVVLEPAWFYVIDPLPTGILTLAKGSLVPASVVIIQPQTLWLKNYSGIEEAEARRQEDEDM